MTIKTKDIDDVTTLHKELEKRDEEISRLRQYKRNARTAYTSLQKAYNLLRGASFRHTMNTVNERSAFFQLIQENESLLAQLSVVKEDNYILQGKNAYLKDENRKFRRSVNAPGTDRGEVEIVHLNQRRDEKEVQQRDGRESQAVRLPE